MQMWNPAPWQSHNHLQLAQDQLQKPYADFENKQHAGRYTLALAKYGASIELISLNSSGLSGKASFSPLCQLDFSHLCQTLKLAGLDPDAVLGKETAEGVHLLANPNLEASSPQPSSRTSREQMQASFLF